ncbi:hypothetical protein AAVH_34491, partial [Aphelenchoides avenae]
RKHVQKTDSFPLVPLLDGVFRELKRHYEQSYEDIALRLDNIVQLVYELQRVRHHYEEHVIVLRLYGKQTFLPEISEAVEAKKLHQLVRFR